MRDELWLGLRVVPLEKAERADAAANRKRILRAAERLFAERGVDGVNMVDIARAARVGQGTLYRRFPSKGALCLALLDEQMRAFQNTVLDTLNAMAQDNAPWLERLQWFLDALIRFNAMHIPLLRAAQHGVERPEQFTNSAPFSWERMTVIGLLREAMRRGEISPSCDARLIGDLLLAPMHPEVFYFLHYTSGYTLEQLSAALRASVSALSRA
ncbi:MAG: TetR/AcrR family transcriptional regulator [Thermoflexales bacterium]|nr:TetR/AcrR family transcriptional regulator [Thermoflexales bacterium]MCS7324645.1 TetR/AcrR family transcriptional regulator [Thermoflexales bacterium]MCX7939813.1 TetR/AcrR family transcriptional regulator [Thermoflexales bacterium]MDW8053156.1 helix-turn-helix domain-containing protein [Anaerolineae bacterium]MDW8291808.1 helix-turn-helix domain-containing protein [Anaerolineae bacterium]